VLINSVSQVLTAVFHTSCILLLAACSTLGPKPDLKLVGAETKSTKKVSNILVLSTTGTYDNDLESDLNKTVPAGAYKNYSDHLLIVKGLGQAAKTLGMPAAVLPVIGINWEADFHSWILSTQKKIISAKPNGKMPAFGRKNSLLRLPRPKTAMPIPKTDAELKKLAATLKSYEPALKALSKAQESNDPTRLALAMQKHPVPLPHVEALFQHMVQRFKISYVITSTIIGTPDDFEEDKVIHLFVAMINTKTGRFRYASHSFGQKSDVPTTFVGLIGLMSLNLFNEIEAQDEIQF
jgi:hypothetical protein